MRAPFLFTLSALAGLVLAVSPVGSAAASGSPPSAWYQPGAYAGHSGSNDYEKVVTSASAPTLTAAWTRKGATSPPLVSGGRAWTVGEDGVLRSYGVVSGAPVTTTAVGRCTKGAAPPVMSATVVVVPTTGCGQPDSVRAFSAANGHPLWQCDLPKGVASATVKNAVLYVTGGRGTVSALDLGDGHVRWARSGGRTVFSSALSDGVLYTTTFQKVQARRLSDGAVLWSHGAGEYDSYVAAAGDRVYVSYVNGAGAAGSQRLLALSSAGATLWTAFVGESISFPDVRPSVSGDTVLVSSVNGDVVALDATTGAQRWAAPTESDDLSTVSVAGGVAYTVEDGVLYGRAVATGALLVQRTVTGAEGEPVVAAGHVLVGGSSLRAFAPS